jgi:hypothetical protein
MGVHLPEEGGANHQLGARRGTQGAEATRDGATPIDLIDGELLIDKLKELKLGLRSRMVENVEVDVAWFTGLYSRPLSTRPERGPR